MNHSFDIADAEKYGVHAAIILNNIKFWQEKSRANGENFNDGRYWVYNSVRAWAELFPYLSAKQVRTALEHLVDAGALVSGVYNKSAYDRTKWYSSTCDCGQIDLPKKANEFDLEGQPIPDVITDIGTDTSEDTNVSLSAAKAADCPHAEIVSLYHEILPELNHVEVWNQQRKKFLQSRWREGIQAKHYADKETGLAYWRRFFRFVRTCPLLMGKVERKDGSTWQADLEWLIRPTNYAKVIEGKYAA